ncbi:MAG: hypothetical protein SF052_26065 [Bacteroidia bacterium]|nr:hypothetical protein [Bacteroidia bacterium]
MMRKINPCRYLILCVHFSLFTQSVFSQVTRNEGFLDVNKGLPNSFIQEIPFIPESYRGSFYVEEEWMTGNIYLPDSSLIAGVPLRYDLQADRLEIRFPDGVRILENEEILQFDGKDMAGNVRVFVGGDRFRFTDENALSGLVELLVNGEKLKLISHYELILKEGNYNVQIDIGDRTPEWVQKEKFYFVVNEAVYAISANARKQEMFFGGKAEVVNEFVKQNHLHFKEKGDLVKIAIYYNSL